ncbi:hypothetical protein SAMN05444169_2241 [Bradyrhizobium erythrophlei]|uniref:Uncharacterized protein n=1 Tax=Bradyrhizobium erythrophlei TaxID=1437360 RepID=A0A1M5JHW3_9BRAD|nr:hypothetical protein SAMN05444169_2241 [Bradyrhizobium erythrophlei]
MLRIQFSNSLPSRTTPPLPPRSGGEGSGGGGSIGLLFRQRVCRDTPHPLPATREGAWREGRSPCMAPRSRRMFRARFCHSFRPLRSEGAGNAGRPMRPIAACAMSVVERTRVVRSHRETPRIPRAMVLRLMSYSPRRSGFFVTVIPEKLVSPGLDAGVEASGPHDFAVRVSAVRQERPRVHCIPSRVRDDREPPLCGTGRCAYRTDLVFRKTRIFLQRGLDRPSRAERSDLPDGSPIDLD